MKTSSRRLKDVFRLCLQETSWRRLGKKDEYVRLSLTSSKDVFKSSSRCLGQDQYIRLGHVFKTSCKNVFKTFRRCLQDVFKSSSRRLQNVFKTSSTNLQDFLQRYLQDVFKAYDQVKLFFLTCLWEEFNTLLGRSFPKTVIHRGICVGDTTSEKFMVSAQNLQER